MKDIQNKNIIITGASSGIGKSLAYECAAKGANLTLAARNFSVLKGIAIELESKYSIQVLIVETDVTKELDCEILIKTSVEKFGRIDVLICNAGISMRALFDETNLEVIKSVMNVNFWGTVYCSHFAISHLLKSNGTLVGISSIAGYKGLPGRSGYSASKFAMQGFLESIRIENLKKGLDVLVACPGFTSSNIRNVALAKDGTTQGESPLNESKITSSEEVAKAIIHAIVDQKRTLVLSSQGKLTVWLNKFFPAWLDKMVYKHFASEPDSPLK